MFCCDGIIRYLSRGMVRIAAMPIGAQRASIRLHYFHVHIVPPWTRTHCCRMAADEKAHVETLLHHQKVQARRVYRHSAVNTSAAFPMVPTGIACSWQRPQSR